MSETWIISDTHFGHVNICKFLRNDGCTPLRPWDNVDEMDEALIANWNNVVAPTDKVYHLGDVVMAKRHLNKMARLNGDLRLIMGNHDVFDYHEYSLYFKKIMAYKELDDMILSHIPLSRNSVVDRYKHNVHGHLHSNRVMYEKWPKKIDPIYFCASVEHINYTPIHIEEVRRILKEQKSND